MRCPCCEECGSAYAIAHHMERSHSKRNGPNRKFKYPCGWPACSRELFGHRNNMLEHYFQHTQAKPYMCKKCSLRTNSQSSIYRHYLRLHGRKATTADVIVFKGNGCEWSAIEATETEENLPAAPPASQTDRRKSRRHSPYASARQTRQSRKKACQQEEVSSEDFAVMQPLDINVISTSYTSGSGTLSAALASSSTAGGVNHHYYGAGAVPELASSYFPGTQYPVAGWTFDPYLPTDVEEYPYFVVEEESPASLSPVSPYAQPLGPSYVEASVIDPTLLAPSYVPQRSVSPAESTLSASSAGSYDFVDVSTSLSQPLIWSSDFTFSEDFSSYDLGEYPPYTFHRY